MKKHLQKFAVIVMALLAIPFTLYVAASTIEFTSFYISLAGLDTDACIHYYEGESRGMIWERGEWHHYVDFKVDASAPRNQWELVNAPLPSNIWMNPSPLPNVIRASYRWPFNWQDPFPVNSWRICLLSLVA